MKKFYLLSVTLLSFTYAILQAQAPIYYQTVNYTGINLRGGTQILAQIDAQFSSDGFVVVHFDGECYASVGDRIILAASNNGNWSPNDGNVGVETSEAGFGRPFSHTRVYPVSTGSHTYYAVAQNVVEMEGTGVASIYGTLTVEYFPDTSPAVVKSNGFFFNGDVTNSTVVAEQTIHAGGAGKILVRFDGWLTSPPGDRIVLAASNNGSWSFNEGNVAVEAVNEGDVDENSFSHTQVYNVSAAGDYTYYAVSQVYGETGGDHIVWIYGNLLVEFYPTSGPEKILVDGFTLPEIDLNGQSTTLTSIVVDAPAAGKVMAVFDGYLTANEGYDIVLAASDNGDWTINDGNVTLQALDNDQNRYSFSHTRVYNVSAGSHTYYAVGEIFGGSGSETADIFGHLTVKYFPNSSTAVSDLSDSKNSFDVYPNPSLGASLIAFKNPVDSKTKIQLLDSNGRVLQEYPTNGKEEMTIDLSAFPANLYWIKAGQLCNPVVKM
jgi:hypothetical protein